MAILDLKQIKAILIQNEDRIILSVGFILVAFLSFGAGKLSETYHPQTPIIFQDAPKCGTTGGAAQTAPAAASTSANSPINSPRFAGEAGEPVAAGAQTQGKIIGNKNSMIYHIPGGAFYDRISAQNRIYFNSEQEAQKAGYRKSKQ